jgi:acetolactate synthase-1/2/3 large subunit
VSETPIPETTGGDAAVMALLDGGVDTVFGLPGVQLDGLFNALHGARDRLRVINARHEQGVAYMALGYAQASGRIGVYACVPGPGFLNTGAALSTAYATGAPVLALVGQIASGAIGAGGGELHELPDQTAIVAGLTRWNGLARTGAEIPALMAEAIGRLRHHLGPVAVELPADVLKQAGPIVPASWSAVLPPIDEDAIAEAAALLDGANRPMILVGGGALSAGEGVRALAQRLQAPVVSHLQGRGILDSRSPYSIGPLAASRIWPETDVIVAVGTRFHTPRKAWRLREGQRVIRIDLDAAQFSRGVMPDVALHGDAGAVLAALLLRLSSSHRNRASRQDELSRLKAGSDATFAERLAPQMAYITALRDVLPDDATVVCDYTQVGYVATAAYPATAPRRVLTPGYQGTLGFAYATALGAKVARPGSPCVALCGDGGFLFTGNELATAVQHGIGAIAVVFTDDAYGNVRRMQADDYGGKVIASELRNPDFVRFAEAFGAPARRAHDPDELRSALRWAIEQGGPALIEVPVGAMPNPWRFLEPRLP